MLERWSRPGWSLHWFSMPLSKPQWRRHGYTIRFRCGHTNRNAARIHGCLERCRPYNLERNVPKSSLPWTDYNVNDRHNVNNHGYYYSWVYAPGTDYQFRSVRF